jgi:ABC-type nitrate/sulfonate/bicarbonate transport system substrate-binding protein
MVGKWLSILGLTLDDVTLVNMDQPSAVPAFEKGIGDAVCLWAPFIFAARQRGWLSAGNMGQMNCDTVSELVGDKDWCDKNPELVAKFLRVFFRASKLILEEGPSDRLVELHRQYMNEFAGMRMTLDENRQDMIIHPRYSYEESLALLDDSGGISQIDQWQYDFAAFFESLGRYSPAEIQQFKDSKINTDKFMKMVKLPL